MNEEMTPRGGTAFALLFTWLVACGTSSSPPPSASTGSSGKSAASSTPLGDVDRSALKGLDGTLGEARTAASAIATANAATKAEAARILVKQLEFTESEAWRAKHQGEVAEANHRAGITATDEQLDAQMRGFQDEEIAGLVSLAPKIGGRELVAKCFEIATGPRPKAQKAARGALEAMKASLDPKDATRLSELAASAEVAAPDASGADVTADVTASVGDIRVTGGKIANAPAVVAGMLAGFRRCYKRAATQGNAGEGTVSMKLEVDAQGAVTSATPTVKGAELGAAPACIAARAASAQFDPPAGGGAVIEFDVKLGRAP